MGITGAILGDISGSQYEFDKPKGFNAQTCQLYSKYCMFTDDTVMSLAVKYAIDNGIEYGEAMRKIGIKYPDCGYGGRFYRWIMNQETEPYNSWGNGSAMRASYIGEYFENVGDVIREAEKSAAVTHNHPEGIKGAVTTAVCVWMAKHGKSKQEIYDYVLKQYPSEDYRYTVNGDLNKMALTYTWDVSCQGSVPVAMKCFLDSDSYETFLRNVYKFDCDADTLACIGGGVAEEYYGSTGLDNEAILKEYLDGELWKIYNGNKISL